MYLRGRSVIYIEVAYYYSEIFARKNKAFLDISELPSLDVSRGIAIYLKSDFKNEYVEYTKQVNRFLPKF